MTLGSENALTRWDLIISYNSHILSQVPMYPLKNLKLPSFNVNKPPPSLPVIIDADNN